jgi:hypothetical protein
MALTRLTCTALVVVIRVIANILFEISQRTCCMAGRDCA